MCSSTRFLPGRPAGTLQGPTPAVSGAQTRSDHHVVAVSHRGAARIAQHLGDPARTVARDDRAPRRRRSRRAPRDQRAVGPQRPRPGRRAGNRPRRRARRPAAATCRAPARPTAPASTMRLAQRLHARDPLLARGVRVAVRLEPGRGGARRQRRAAAGRPSPRVIAMAQPPCIAVLAAISLVRMPPRDSAVPAPPAIASISGVISATYVEPARPGRSADRRCRARRHPRAAPARRRRPSARRCAASRSLSP